jgi:hypothetical protein
VNGKRLNRILEAELAVARLTAPRADDTAAGLDDAAPLAEMRRLLADPPPPSPRAQPSRRCPTPRLSRNGVDSDARGDRAAWSARTSRALEDSGIRSPSGGLG